ncbi:MAG: MerR family DNA-binding protein [Gemmatimonadales bacterium]
MAMTIGRLAAKAGVNIQTVRYYERRGLIESPNRTRAGYRQYSADAARQIRFIKRAQDLGFSLNEIGELLALRIDHVSACQAVKEKTLSKIATVEQKIAELGALKKALERFVESCEARVPTGECPMLEFLDEEE